MSNMGSDFWGLVLVPGKKFTPDESMPIRLTQISFGEKVIKGSRTCVFIRKETQDYAICSLLEGNSESATVDIRLPETDDYSLYISGPNDVHLTGEVLAPEEEDLSEDEKSYLSQLYGDLENDEDEEDSDELEAANIEEIAPEELNKIINGINKPTSNGSKNPDIKRKVDQNEVSAPDTKRTKENSNPQKNVSTELPKVSSNQETLNSKVNGTTNGTSPKSKAQRKREKKAAAKLAASLKA